MPDGTNNIAKTEVDWGKADPDISYNGQMITLPDSPEKMPIDAAIHALERKKADEETLLSVHEIIDAYPEDALVAVNEAMRQIYGWSSPTPKMTFFGPQAPDLVTIKTGAGEGDVTQVPFGEFKLPNVENNVVLHRSRDYGGSANLIIAGSVRKRERHILVELARRTREILKNHSIYRGKAILLDCDSDGELAHDRPPNFLDVRNIDPNELVLNDDEYAQIRASLWAPIQNTDACVAHGIPLNRGVLLEGVYGTGKTMTAHTTARICEDNGWTFIMLKDVRGLKDALVFAQRYQPAVVFAEDIDRVISERDQGGNDLLNTIDGVISKNSKVMTVLTTNHVERLEKAMLRPGRLDSIVKMRPPHGRAVDRLLRQYGRGLLDETEDLSEVCEQMGGNIPATLREVVERSKLGMVADGRTQINAADLMIAAGEMTHHLELMKEHEPSISTEEQLGVTMGDVLSNRLDAAITGQMERTVEAALVAMFSNGGEKLMQKIKKAS